MNNEIQIANFQSQISAKGNSLQTLYGKRNQHMQDYDQSLSNKRRLEQELENLLFYKKKAMEECQRLESLTGGASSPMGRIQFVKSGLLEGNVLTRVQERIVSLRAKQRTSIEKAHEGVQDMKAKAKEIELELEQEKQNLINIDNYIATNDAQINRLRSDISSLNAQLRSL